jgi:AraC-like DNA-binding protein
MVSSMAATDAIPVRKDWVEIVESTLQWATSVIALAAPLSARDAVLTSLTSLPRPSSELERQVIRGLLLEFAIRSSLSLHRRNCPDPEACALLPMDLIALLAEANDPVDGAVQWLDAFWLHLRRHHRPTLGVHVAELLRSEPTRRWRMQELARQVGASPRAIRSDFQRLFRRTPKDYQTLLRIADGLRRVNCEKVDGLAMSLGYKSKKDFYAHFKRCTGMTPQQYRRMDPAAASRIQISLDSLLKR